MIDSKYSTSRLKKAIEQFTEKVLLNHFSANQMTITGFILGVFGALFIGIYGFGSFSSGFHEFQHLIWDTIRQGGFSKGWQKLKDIGLFGWKWSTGDTLLLFGSIFMILSFSADVFDGNLARLTKPTKFGGILDIFSDRLVELMFLIVIISLSPENLLWPGLISFAAIVACITIFLLIGGATESSDINEWSEQQKVIYYSSGIMERSETFLFILFLLTLVPLQVVLMWFFAILVWITAFQRFYHAYRLFY